MIELPENALQVAQKAVLEAGKLIIALQPETRIPDFKLDKSPVTIADRKAEMLIREIVCSYFPKSGFSGEELGDLPSGNGMTWACDPIDGTWSYLNRETTCAICLSLQINNQTVLAVIYNPFTQEIFSGSVYEKPVFNGMIMPVCQKKSLSDSVINFFIHRSKTHQTGILYDLRKEKKINKLVSLGGSIAYALACVAKGAHQGFIGLSGRPSRIWDMAAGKFLVESTGGIVTGLNGEKLDTDFPAFTPLIAASDPIIHKRLLSCLKEKGF